MKAIIVEPDARPRVADIQSDLRSLRSIVGKNSDGINRIHIVIGCSKQAFL